MKPSDLMRQFKLINPVVSEIRSYYYSVLRTMLKDLLDESTDVMYNQDVYSNNRYLGKLFKIVPDETTFWVYIDSGTTTFSTPLLELD